MGAFEFWGGWKHTPSKHAGYSRRRNIIVVSGGVVGALLWVLIEWLRQL
jgi:hypothetical protein